MLQQMALFHSFLCLSDSPLSVCVCVSLGVCVCVYTHTISPHHLYLFTCPWTCRLSLCLGYCKQKVLHSNDMKEHLIVICFCMLLTDDVNIFWCAYCLLVHPLLLSILPNFLKLGCLSSCFWDMHSLCYIEMICHLYVFQKMFFQIVVGLFIFF